MAKGVPARLSAAEARRFGLTVAAGFLVLAALVRWRGGSGVPAALAGLGVALALTATLVPIRVGGVYRAWMGLGRLLSGITTPVVLGSVYFLLITPIGLVLRLLGRNSLERRRGVPSLWVAKASAERRSDMRRQF